ncbi:MAG: hypothetical protein N3D10_04040 [Candidatus Micrarchaeota archaeon]|nr:hypothetical protein [Candidatus Micrarchaeota archaeon]
MKFRLNQSKKFKIAAIASALFFNFSPVQTQALIKERLLVIFLKHTSQEQSYPNNKSRLQKSLRHLKKMNELEPKEQDRVYINYCRYIENLVAIGTALEIGLYSQWRKYHNYKLAKEIADTLDGLTPVKLTELKIYLGENSSKEELKKSLKIF